MEVAILGPLEVRTDDDALAAMAGTTQIRVLAALAAFRGRVLDAARLAEMVKVSVSSLRSAVSRLRAVVGEDVVDTVGAGYRLGQVVGVDADRFTAALDRARVESPEVAVGLCEEALALWRGDPLPELDGVEWVVPLVVALVEQRAAVVEERIESLIGCGRFADAVVSSQEHIGEFPYRDRPRGLLMRALAADGRQVEALRTYRQYWSLLGEELGTEPGGELVELERRIVAGWHDIAPVFESGAAVDRAGSLRPVLSSFVGRDRLLGEVVAALRGRRLVTLFGVGGVGKTRLALETGLGSDRWSDGVWMVELQRVETAEGVPAAVANALAIRQLPGMSMTESIVQWAQHRRMLVILDNCEHVLSAAAVLVEAIIDATVEVVVLATSREPLLVSGEHVIPVPPLATNAEGGGQAAAVELFIDRARDELGSFNSQEHAVAVEEICRRLDGIPLAIELAAARARGLTVETIAARLDERFRLLTAGRRTAVERHATLRAAIDWSHDLLDDTQRRVFDAVSVFAGPFSLDDATAITADDVDELNVTDAIAQLVDRSLIVRADTKPEYRLLETLRTYGRDRLARDQRADHVARSHVTLMDAKAEHACAAAAGPDEADVIAGLVAQMADYSAAIGQALDQGRLDVAVRIAAHIAEPSYTWGQHRLVTTRWMVELVDHDFVAPETAAANRWMAANWCIFFGGDMKRAGAYAHEATQLDPGSAMAHVTVAVFDMVAGRADLAVAAGDLALATAITPTQRHWALMAVGHAALQAGDIHRAANVGDQFLESAQRIDHPSAIAMAHHLRGRVFYERDPGEALHSYEQGLAVARQRVPDCWVVPASFLRDMIPVARRHDLGRAAGIALEALEISMRHNETGQVISMFAQTAMVLHDLDRVDMAARALGAAGDTALSPTDARDYAQTQQALRKQLGDRYDQLTTEGARTPPVDMTRHLVTELRTLRGRSSLRHAATA